jgi:hypothetical protein
VLPITEETKRRKEEQDAEVGIIAHVVDVVRKGKAKGARIQQRGQLPL